MTFKLKVANLHWHNGFCLLRVTRSRLAVPYRTYYI